MQIKNIDISDLLQGLIKKDRKSYDYLYDKYSAKLYGIALNITQKADIAEDVLQETFIKVYKNVHKFDDSRGSFAAWLINICRNGAIDKIRYGKESRKIQFDTLNVDISTDIDPEIKRANDELWEVLERLGDEHKELLRLSYYFGFTHQEISEKLDMPLGSVNSKLRIALRELRKIYP